MYNNLYLNYLPIPKEYSTFSHKREYKRKLDSLKYILPMSEKRFNFTISKILNPVKFHISIFVKFYEEVNIYRFSVAGGNYYTITKEQLVIICNHCEKNMFEIENNINLDYNSILRRMKIEKIMKKI
jgi:hypothetical protein